ncbi:MAG: hypothetical protein AWM53_01032 [Candidatus Dichloromethanomonas elyunquensis]|nr:MAG: hypothetical protein AWM53_01032 [Candidatus Dichloromethanomonas elyunquensis]
MRKGLGIFIFCVIILISAGGCSKPTQGEPGGEAPAVISVWYSFQGKSEEELLRQFTRINKEHPGVIVKGEKVAESNFVQKVWNLQAGGEGPEIMIASRATIFHLYEKGAISPALADQYHAFPSAQAVFTFNHQLFAAPWIADVPILYYRKDRVQEPPLSLSEILDNKNTVAVKTLNLALLSPWWKAEGGILSSEGMPVIDGQGNIAFLNKLLYLKSEGLLLFDSQGQDRLVKGEVNYYLGWASDSTVLDKAGIPWGSVSLAGLLGANGRVFLDHTLGIANSSVKTVSGLENSIRLVEEELLKIETEESVQKSTGNVPLEDAYYNSFQSGSYNDQIRITLENAWYLEGNNLDWRWMEFENTAWKNVSAGSNIEKELSTQQLLALEAANKP